MCGNVRELTLENGVEEICREAFSYCTGLRSLTIPGSVKTIGREAFLYGANIESLTLGEGIELIEDGAFRGLVELKSVTVPGSVRRIGASAFKRCVCVTELELGDGLEEIGPEAFYGCRGLKSVVIPDSVIRVGKGAFSECGNISVTFAGMTYTGESIASIYYTLTDYPEGEQNRSKNTLNITKLLSGGSDLSHESVDDEFVVLQYDKLRRAANEYMTVEELLDLIDSGEWDEWDGGDVTPKLSEPDFESINEAYRHDSEMTDEEAPELLERRSKRPIASDSTEACEDDSSAPTTKRRSYLNRMFGDAPIDDGDYDAEYDKNVPRPAFLGNLGEGLNDTSGEMTEEQYKRLNELIESGITLTEFNELCKSGKLFED